MFPAGKAQLRCFVLWGVVCLPFDVTHDIAGLASLVEKLKALDGETRVVMEHTGRYYEAVEKALHEAGFFVRC